MKTCPECWGWGELSEEYLGSYPCKDCKGTGKLSEAEFNKLGNTMEDCCTCCGSYGGTGRIVIDPVEGTTVKCQKCKGKGTVKKKMQWAKIEW